MKVSLTKKSRLSGSNAAAFRNDAPPPRIAPISAPEGPVPVATYGPTKGMSREIRPVLKPQIAPRDRRDRCQENEEGERDQCCNVRRDKKPVISITHVDYVCVRGAHPSKTATDRAALQVPARLREVRLSNAKRAPTSIIVTNKNEGM